MAAGRAAALVAARAADSRDKRRRALDAVQKLEAAGEPVTFPAVARSARVSTWLVYAPGVREHVEAARRRQAVAGIDTSSTTPLATRTDLGPLRAELIARVSELEAVNRRLVAERDARNADGRGAELRVRELEDELAAARESLRRMIRSENSR